MNGRNYLYRGSVNPLRTNRGSDYGKPPFEEQFFHEGPHGLFKVQFSEPVLITMKDVIVEDADGSVLDLSGAISSSA